MLSQNVTSPTGSQKPKPAPPPKPRNYVLPPAGSLLKNKDKAPQQPNIEKTVSVNDIKVNDSPKQANISEGERTSSVLARLRLFEAKSAASGRSDPPKSPIPISTRSMPWLQKSQSRKNSVEPDVVTSPTCENRSVKALTSRFTAAANPLSENNSNRQKPAALSRAVSSPTNLLLSNPMFAKFRAADQKEASENGSHKEEQKQSSIAGELKNIFLSPSPHTSPSADIKKNMTTSKKNVEESSSDTSGFISFDEPATPTSGLELIAKDRVRLGQTKRKPRVIRDVLLPVETVNQEFFQ